MTNVFQPPVTTNYMVRPGQPPKLVEVISELGIFGYVIGYYPRFSIKCSEDASIFLELTYISIFQEQGQDHNEQTGQFHFIKMTIGA